MPRKILVIGAGHAGGSVVAFLRQQGYAGSITVVGEEPLLPYQRPPLSKAWLKGEADGDSLALRAPEFYTENAIDVLTSAKVERIDRLGRRVILADGRALSYDALIVATGATPIRLDVPGADLGGVHVLRSAADAEGLKRNLGAGRRLAVIGGGYIGLEVAASAITLGGGAVVIEREERLLARSGSAIVANFFRDYHQRQGATILLGAEVTGFAGANGHIKAVRLADGSSIACDLALVGVGVAPNDQLAATAGLACDRGVIVDIGARTSDSSIFAIGDCARRPIPLYGRRFCPESVPNALEQARQVAAAVVGGPPPSPEVPWNWSDQYDLKLQIAGLPFDVDTHVVRGDPRAGRFAIFHLHKDRVQQVEAVNSPPEFMVGKQLILHRTLVNPAKLADTGVSMRDVGA